MAERIQQLLTNRDIRSLVKLTGAGLVPVARRFPLEFYLIMKMHSLTSLASPSKSEKSGALFDLVTRLVTRPCTQ